MVRRAPRRNASDRGPRGRYGWLVSVGVVVVLTAVVVLVVAQRTSGAGKGSTGTAAGVLTPGTPAPPVVLPSTTAGVVDLAAYRGKQNVLLFFYEHAG